MQEKKAEAGSRYTPMSLPLSYEAFGFSFGTDAGKSLRP
jgi:hypothetical protein